jgi:hypothetical protein
MRRPAIASRAGNVRHPERMKCPGQSRTTMANAIRVGEHLVRRLG